MYSQAEENTGTITLRPEVRKFAEAMELKLRKHDGKKTHWAEQPIEAHVKLSQLEVQEFMVADEFFTVDQARGEAVDVANFFMIIWDKLGKLPGNINRHTHGMANK